MTNDLLTSLYLPLMSAPVSFRLQDNTFWLLAQKAVYWEEQKTIILADLHLGKTGHFRKEGIAVPQGVYKDDLHRLFDIIQQYKPEQLIIAGDMFHSRMNKEVDLFTRWRRDLSQLPIRLIKGNHDILHNDHYTQADITISDCSLVMEKFCFVHDIEDVRRETGNDKRETTNVKEVKSVAGVKRQTTDVKSANDYEEDNPENTKPKRKKATTRDCAPEFEDKGYYYLSGHIHPGVIVRTGPRQSVCLACYYFGKEYAVLPAFSAFTGCYPVRPVKGDNVFAVLKDSVMKIKA
jgi:DNA ligase-associated metallophosphoesterase